MRFKVLKSVFALAFMLAVQHSFSQERQLGTWKMFLPYGNSIGICDAGDKLYSAAHYSVFSYELSSGIIQTYDKSSGLSDIGIQTINYDPATKFLAIVYTDNNLDFIYNGTDVYNIPDFQSASANGAVSIYSVSFHNGNAYLSSDLGISVVNLTKLEIDDTYTIGSNGQPQRVYSTCIDSVNIYAATDNGIKYAPLSSPNLEDFNSWQLFTEAQNLPLSKTTSLAVLNDTVYAVIAGPGSAPDTLYRYNIGSNSWQRIYYNSADNDSIISLATDGYNHTLYFSTWNQTAQNGGTNMKYSSANGFGAGSSAGFSHPIGWFENNNASWYADYYNGTFKNNSQSPIAPDGPFSNNVFAMEAKNKVLTVAAGGVDDSWYYTFNPDGFSIYKNNNWLTENVYNNSVMNNNTCLDVLAVATVDAFNKTYAGSFYGGLIEYDNNSQTTTVYNESNSSGWLEGAIGDLQRTRISCLAVDRYNNLWIGNSDAPHLIKLLEPDGTRRSYKVPYNIEALKKIIIDENDQLWIPSRAGVGGLLVWSYNGTLDDTTDDKSILLLSGAGQGGLPNNGVNCVAEDLTGYIWAGTDQGIGVFYCPSNVLQSGGCDAQQIEVSNNGYLGYLFGMQSVRAIAVDAANRKWIGTSEGLWLISADGLTQLLNFTSSNSPLPSNIVTDIQIDNTTGEVFIGTTGGLVSYQGDAIDTCVGCKEALVYPNPVKPDYTGPIAIKGLVDGAYVKITDVSGTLMFQGAANGTQMIWNGLGYNGIRAKSGVYLVFSSDNSGKERRVAKILITN